MMAASVMSFTSCGENEVINQSEEQDQSASHGKVAVKLVCSPTPSVSYTRASMAANGKQLTDLYILDYNKATGKLLQVLHQTSTAEDFSEPTLNSDYGNHTLKVIIGKDQAIHNSFALSYKSTNGRSYIPILVHLHYSTLVHFAIFIVAL